MSNSRYVQTFEVIGSGVFPLDMLRRDYCYPENTIDAVTIGCEDDERRVALKRTVENRDLVPNLDRWRSFGWTVDPLSIKTRSYARP